MLILRAMGSCYLIYSADAKSILPHYANNSSVISISCLPWSPWWWLVVHWTCLYALFHDFSHFPLIDIELLSDILLGVITSFIRSHNFGLHEVTQMWHFDDRWFVLILFQIAICKEKKNSIFFWTTVQASGGVEKVNMSWKFALDALERFWHVACDVVSCLQLPFTTYITMEEIEKLLELIWWFTDRIYEHFHFCSQTLIIWCSAQQSSVVKKKQSKKHST